ncbi:MAG TPA: hypothetical protein VGX25_21065 [Actinophytocola sp.]|uniref:hypothetical protein n=1 Tax=Actinophytocola sp. TaxID=1872138 RepID=UPI002DDC9715|nr:hypothetical protein [Actinophytocola sp.]HEV2781886.1 hypothetical protein [Actinophytocola sp.]
MATIPVHHDPDATPQPPVSASPAPPGTTPDWSDDVAKSRFSAWRVPVGERLQWLQAELDERPPGPLPTGVPEAMQIAYRSTMAKANLASWYSGSHIERAWRALHLAEAKVIASSPDLPARLPAVRARALEDLKYNDWRVEALDAIDPDRIGTHERATVAEALRAAFTISDNSHTGVRSLRNRLVLFGLLLLGLNLVLGALSSLIPSLLPLCVKGICPTGGPGPTGGDIWLVQLLGALGGAVAVVILLLNTRPSVVAYTLTPYQATIKIMLGSVLAVVGVLIAGTGLLQDIVANRPALLVLALVLGYAQHLGTRFLDHYADFVVGKAQPKVGEEQARATAGRADRRAGR